MALTGPNLSAETAAHPRVWEAKTTSSIWKFAIVGFYPSGGSAGYIDNMGADSSLVCLGVARNNCGAVPAGHTAAFAAEAIVDELIHGNVIFSGPTLTTANRNALVYAVDENTGTLTSGTPPIGMLLEVIDGTHGKVGVGPTYVARAVAAALASATASNPFQVDEWTNPIAPSTVNLLAATLITTDPQTESSFVSAGVAAILAYPRNIVVTGGGTTAHCPTQVVFTGTDIDGNALTETLALSSGGGTGIKAFKTLTSAAFTGATTGDGSCALGAGAKMGFSKSIKSRAGRLASIQQVAAGSVVTTGTFVDATTSPPHGTYAPATAQDGANDYSVTYEHS